MDLLILILGLSQLLLVASVMYLRATIRRFRRAREALASELRLLGVEHQAQQICQLALDCYEKTRDMQLYSTTESDEYWEFAEAAMQVLADHKGEELPRKEADE